MEEFDDERISGIDDVKRRGHGFDVGDPEGVSLDILQGNNIDGDSDVFEGAADHEHPFTCGERVAEVVADFGAADTDDEFVDLVGDAFDDGSVTVVIRLESSDVEAAFHCFLPMSAAVRAATAPAVNPASMLTTVIAAQDWSMEARAASP